MNWIELVDGRRLDCHLPWFLITCHRPLPFWLNLIASCLLSRRIVTLS